MVGVPAKGAHGREKQHRMQWRRACNMHRRMSNLALSVLSALLLITVGCSAPAPMAQQRAGADAPAGTGEGDPDPSSPSKDPDATMREGGPLGVVAIDLQQVFFDTAAARNPTADIAKRMARSAHVFELAAAHQVPVFLTFEATKSGDHALPPSLSAVVPKPTTELIKTTFAATGQPQFLPAIKASGARRLVVIGAETDVCVLQTVLGLRRAGYEVIAAMDAIFTEEVNTGPAARRMRQAGVVQLGMQEAETLLSTGGSSPAPPASATPVIVRPLETGILLHDVAGTSAVDPSAAAKMVRLRELLLVSEWFRLPVLAKDPAAVLAALPPALRSILTRPIVALANKPSAVTQLAVAGGHAGIATAVAEIAGKVDVFLVEDALLGGGSADLEPLYVKGAVPTTYKTLYYELIQSVNEAQWPSPQWVTDGAKYFDLTKAPEELPPLTVP
jgi:nicotinamidase-related amidase